METGEEGFRKIREKKCGLGKGSRARGILAQEVKRGEKEEGEFMEAMESEVWSEERL